MNQLTIPRFKNPEITNGVYRLAELAIVELTQELDDKLEEILSYHKAMCSLDKGYAQEYECLFNAGMAPGQALATLICGNSGSAVEESRAYLSTLLEY